ncbi:hypothetical protein ACOMHN_002801 [Nucella lapillus]
MVDFRGFKHSDVPTGSGEVGTSIGESKKAHIGGGGLNIRKCSTALRESRLLPPLTRLGNRFFYSPKKTISGVLSTHPWRRGAREVGSSIVESKKATRNISAIAELTLRESRLLPPLTRPAVDRFFYSLNILKMVDFRGFKHSDVPEGARGGVNKHRLNIPKMVDFRGFKHSDVQKGAGEVGTSIGESKKAHIGGGGLLP